MSEDNMDVSFVVPAKNEEQNIARCIESLLACDRAGLTVEIIVVDNGSTDGTVSLARSLDVVVLEFPELSISALRNAGASRSKGQWIAFVDADVTIESDWLENAKREINLPGVGAVGASPTIPENSNWVVRTWHLQIGMRPAYCERDWLASMNMLVKREAFENVGGFDETLLTCEDVDLGYRISKSGNRIVYDKRLRAVHFGEAQTLVQLFKKEAWRGSYNYRGLLRHGWQIGELPSLVQPLLSLCGVLCILVGIFAYTPLLLPGLALFATFPVAKAVQTAVRTHEWSAIPALLLVWSTYSLARIWSGLLELRCILFQQSDTIVSSSKTE